MNPDFGELQIAEANVDGNRVTLEIDQGTAKTADRSRNTFGMLNIIGWYMDQEGNIYCVRTESKDVLGNTIFPKTSNKPCHGKNLDRILCLNDENIADGIFSTANKDNFLADTVWKEVNIVSGLEFHLQRIS